MEQGSIKALENELSIAKKQMLVVSRNLAQARVAQTLAAKEKAKDSTPETRRALREATAKMEQIDEAEHSLARTIADLSQRLRRARERPELIGLDASRRQLAELNWRLIRGV